MVWSGGYDSTLVLAEVARRYSSGSSPVIAVVVQSLHLGDEQVAMEEKARAAFLKFAEARGWAIHVVHVRTEVTQAHTATWTVHAVLPQALLWFHAVLPYLCSNDKVWWGYIRRDDYWLIRDRLVHAMEACTAAAFISGVTFEYPLASAEKADVVRTLREIGVPLADLWTCDNPVASSSGITPCQECAKCLSLSKAVAVVEREATLEANRVAAFMAVVEKEVPLEGNSEAAVDAGHAAPVSEPVLQPSSTPVDAAELPLGVPSTVEIKSVAPQAILIGTSKAPPQVTVPPGYLTFKRGKSK